MSSLDCAECKTPLTPNLTACPSCGCPMAGIARPTHATNAVAQSHPRFPWLDLAMLCSGAGVGLTGIALVAGPNPHEWLSLAGVCFLLLGSGATLFNVVDKFLIHRGAPAGRSGAMRAAAAILWLVGLGAPLVLIARATASARRAAASNPESIVSALTEAGRIQLSLPAGWRQVEPSGSFDLAAEGPEGGIFVETSADLGGSKDLKAALNALAASIYADWTAARSATAQLSAHGGREVASVEFETIDRESKQPWRIQLHLVRDEQTLSLIRVASTPEIWLAERPLLERLADSASVEGLAKTD